MRFTRQMSLAACVKMSENDIFLLSRLRELVDDSDSLSGLEESLVDEDDDDDHVFNVDPRMRSESDVDRIVAFVAHIDTFNRFDAHVKRELCRSMVVASINGVGTCVLNDNEVLDSFCVVAAGNLKWTTAQETRVLSVGDEFGVIDGDAVNSTFEGTLHTLDEHCLVLCVPSDAFVAVTRPQQFTEEFEDERVVCVRDANGMIVRATRERLLRALLEENDAFVDDYLLTFESFTCVDDVVKHLMHALDSHREKVLRVALQWISLSTHVPQSFLDTLQKRLHASHLKLLNIAISARAIERHVTFTRSNRDDPLPFDVIGGWSGGTSVGGVFISHVHDTTMDVRVGDQIIASNGIPFNLISLARAQQCLQGTTHVALTIKYNPHAFSEIGTRATRDLGTKIVARAPNNSLKHKLSLLFNGKTRTQPPCDVLRVFYGNECKYLACHADTTAREVTMVAVSEFSLGTSHKSSRDFALYEVALLDACTVKVRRFPDATTRIADACALNARLYVRDVSGTFDESTIVDELKKEFRAHDTICELDADTIAQQLLERNLHAFRAIEAHDFVAAARAERVFEDASNREMFWTVEQLINGQNRIKIAKQLIRVACTCRRARNYNSVFAIVSGLTHASITRLKIVLWEKMAQKYHKQLKQLLSLLDPSRNMLNYRKEISNCARPLVPFFALTIKDLTFVHEANQTLVDDLVNFEKMRLLAREVRHVMRFAESTNQEQEPRVPLAPKQQWEQHVMWKRVTLFLDESMSRVTQDEHVLMSRSLELEPKQQHSPTPSSASSTSSTRLKFGTETETELRKLLSLSDAKTHVHAPQQRSHSASEASLRPLPVESSSVTSLRRLEQISQLRRFHAQHARAVPPSYDQTLQLLKRHEREHRV